MLLEKGWSWEKAACDVLEGLGLNKEQLSSTPNADLFQYKQILTQQEILDANILTHQEEISNRQERIDVVESQIIKRDQDIASTLQWLSDAINLAEILGKAALKQYDLDQNMQADLSRLNQFYWELKQLIKRLRASLATRNSESNQGYRMIDSPSPLKSINFPDVHRCALKLLKEEIPPYIKEEVRTDLEARIDYLAKRLK